MKKLCMIASLISVLPLCGMDLAMLRETNQDTLQVIGAQLLEADVSSRAVTNFSILPPNTAMTRLELTQKWSQAFPRTTSADFFDLMQTSKDFYALSEAMETAYKATLPYYKNEIILSERWKHLKMVNEKLGHKLVPQGTKGDVLLSNSERRWKTFYEVVKITTELVPRRATLLAIGGFVVTGGVLATAAHKCNRPILSMNNVATTIAVSAFSAATAIPYTLMNEGYPIIEKRHDGTSIQETETRTL